MLSKFPLGIAAIYIFSLANDIIISAIISAIMINDSFHLFFFLFLQAAFLFYASLFVTLSFIITFFLFAVLAKLIFPFSHISQHPAIFTTPIRLINSPPSLIIGIMWIPRSSNGKSLVYKANIGSFFAGIRRVGYEQKQPTFFLRHLRKPFASIKKQRKKKKMAGVGDEVIECLNLLGDQNRQWKEQTFLKKFVCAFFLFVYFAVFDCQKKIMFWCVWYKSLYWWTHIDSSW